MAGFPVYQNNPPKVITLCGSARFERLFKVWNEALTLAGHTVFSLSVYPSDKAQREWYTEEQKERLDLAHFKKIEKSDAIMVLNRHGYIGASTLKEVQFAQGLGKKVYFLESWGKGVGVNHSHTQESIRRAQEDGLEIPVVSPIDTFSSGPLRHSVTGSSILGAPGQERNRLLELVRAANFPPPPSPSTRPPPPPLRQIREDNRPSPQPPPVDAASHRARVNKLDGDKPGNQKRSFTYEPTDPRMVGISEIDDEKTFPKTGNLMRSFSYPVNVNQTLVEVARIEDEKLTRETGRGSATVCRKRIAPFVAKIKNLPAGTKLYALLVSPEYSFEAEKDSPEEDSYREWYEEAMAASNEAGFVGLSAAQTIWALNRMLKELEANSR